MEDIVTKKISSIKSLSETQFDDLMEEFFQWKYTSDRLTDIGKYILPRKVLAETFNSTILICDVANYNTELPVIVKCVNVDSQEESEELITEYKVSRMIHDSNIHSRDQFERVYLGDRTPFRPMITKQDRVILPIYDCESAAKRRVDRGGFHGMISLKKYYKGMTLTVFAAQETSDEVNVSVIARVLLACHEAYVKFGLVHNDLHGGNILVVATKDKFARYRVNDKDVFIETYGWKPIIIDLARCTYNGYSERDDDQLFPIQINGVQNPMNDIFTLLALGYVECDAINDLARSVLHGCKIDKNHKYTSPVSYERMIQRLLVTVSFTNDEVVPEDSNRKSLIEEHEIDVTDFAMIGFTSPQFQCLRRSYETLVEGTVKMALGSKLTKGSIALRMTDANECEVEELPRTVISEASERYTGLSQKQYEVCEDNWNEIEHILPTIRMLEVAYFAHRKGYGDINIVEGMTCEDLLSNHKDVVRKFALLYDDLTGSLSLYEGKLSSTPYTILRMLNSMCDILLDFYQ